MASIDRRAEYPIATEATIEGKATAHQARILTTNPLLADIRLREIKSTYRTRQPDVPYPKSDLFPQRRQGDELKTADNVQSAITKGISVDWASTPSDVVRSIVINAIENSQSKLDLKNSFDFLGGHNLQELEGYIRAKTDTRRADITYLLLADLSLLPPRGQAVVLFENIIEQGDPIPTYNAAAEQLKVSKGTVFRTLKQAGLLDSLNERRKELQKIEFPKSQEMAWILGMITGNSGVCNPSKRRMTFSNSNDNKLRAFQRSAEKVFGETVPGTRVSIRTLTSNTHPTAICDSAVITTALGDFSRGSKPDTIRDRHDWVLNSSYIASFASGLFDSGGHIAYSDIRKYVEISSVNPVVADFYNLVLLKLGMTQVRKNVRNFSGQNVTQLYVATQQDLRKFAEQVTSVAPQTQECLDKFKVYRRKKKRHLRISSPLEIVKEWERITEILGHTPLSYEIEALVDAGTSPFNANVYTRHFGIKPDGGKSFPIASDKLNSLMGSTAPEALEEIESVKLTGRKSKYSRQELIDEWVRIKQLHDGRTPTGYIIDKMYRSGETPISLSYYRTIFGQIENGPPLFSVAQQEIEEHISKDRTENTGGETS